ncbi:MAG: glycerol-3-phosphate 1-O-acyltransferase PlsY [Candidatus Latescibacteria bacterium]|nr:glycerol-3-phosphate 1-O-acyltransferase PlsY [Candidatus Latescibacterota bacterium]MCK5379980.1 glycerol-3-phosphate 1-O-acyltransferase PlsY [Candidatus Latescibacterota bacterium]MCK5733635.1 glycerol-3-phosphate 1-O-acyltransferase PlsY [Candidatus Latescibacterota bacterium]
MLTLFAIIVSSYLLGSIPTSILMCRVLKGIDIREFGSKNAGATNVYRVMGWGPALFVAIVDGAKGAVAVLFVSRIAIGEPALDPGLLQIAAGMSAVVGHIWSLFAGFKGGRGVMTAAGVWLALAPIPILIALGVWCLLTFSTGYVSVGSIAAAATLPIALFVGRFGLQADISNPLLAFGCVVGGLLILRHRANIGRLIRGEENRFGKKGKVEVKVKAENCEEGSQP